MIEESLKLHSLSWNIIFLLCGTALPEEHLRLTENKKPKTERRSEIMNLICIAYFLRKTKNKMTSIDNSY